MKSLICIEMLNDFYTFGDARKVGVSVKQFFIKILEESYQCDEKRAEEISLDRFRIDVFT